MKHIIWKACVDYEKEEKWLNGMSARGMAMTDYSWCRYVFEEAPKGEWVYRIEMLENVPTHAESIAYLRFLEENGVEVVATYMRWVYLRKRASEGAFDLYSDLDSKLAHYKRVHMFFLALFIMEFGIGCSNLSIGLGNLLSGNSVGIVNLVGSGMLFVLAAFFLFVLIPLRRKMKALRMEKMIRE